MDIVARPLKVMLVTVEVLRRSPRCSTLSVNFIRSVKLDGEVRKERRFVRVRLYRRSMKSERFVLATNDTHR